MFRYRPYYLFYLQRNGNEIVFTKNSAAVNESIEIETQKSTSTRN